MLGAEGEAAAQARGDGKASGASLSVVVALLGAAPPVSLFFVLLLAVQGWRLQILKSNESFEMFEIICFLLSGAICRIGSAAGARTATGSASAAEVARSGSKGRGSP